MFLISTAPLSWWEGAGFVGLATLKALPLAQAAGEAWEARATASPHAERAAEEREPAGTAAAFRAACRCECGGGGAR
jgi:hypothetical protein